jgi:hypothetical protein
LSDCQRSANADQQQTWVFCLCLLLQINNKHYCNGYTLFGHGVTNPRALAHERLMSACALLAANIYAM